MSTLLQSSDLSASYPSAYRTKILDDVTKSRLDSDTLSESWSLTSSIIKAQSLACNSNDTSLSHKSQLMFSEDSNKISPTLSDCPSTLSQFTPPFSGDLHSLAWLQKNCILNITPLDEEEAAGGLVEAHEVEVTTESENYFGNNRMGSICSDASQIINSSVYSGMGNAESAFKYSSSFSGSISDKKSTSFTTEDDIPHPSQLNASLSSSAGAKCLSQYSSSWKQGSFNDAYCPGITITPPPGSSSLNSSMSSIQLDENGLHKPLSHPSIYGNSLPSQHISLPVSSAGVLHMNSPSSSLNSATKLARPPKPAYSYTHLIFMAIESTPHKCMTVNEIYNWCEANFPYFKSAGAGWKNSLRHNLSINKCFKRIPRDGRSEELVISTSLVGDAEPPRVLSQPLYQTLLSQGGHIVCSMPPAAEYSEESDDSLNGSFNKAEQEGPGRGAYWTVEPKERGQLLDAVKRNPWTLNTCQNTAFAIPGAYQYRSGPAVLSTNLHRVPYQMLDSNQQEHHAYSLFTGYSPISPAAPGDLSCASGLLVKNVEPDEDANKNELTIVEDQQYAMLLKSLEEDSTSLKRVDHAKSSNSKGRYSDADNNPKMSTKDDMPLVHKSMRKMLLNKRKCPSDEECDSQMTERDIQGVMDLFNLQNRSSSNSSDRHSSRSQEFCDECKENQQVGCEACLAKSHSSSNAPSKRTFFVTPAPMIEHEYARYQSALRPRLSSLEESLHLTVDDNASNHAPTSPEYAAPVSQIKNYSGDKDFPERKRRKYNKRKKNGVNQVETYPSSDEEEKKYEPLKKIPRKRGRPSNKDLAANQLRKKIVSKNGDLLELKKSKKSKIPKQSHKSKVIDGGYSPKCLEKTKFQVSSKFFKSKLNRRINAAKQFLVDPKESRENPVLSSSEFVDVIKEEPINSELLESTDSVVGRGIGGANPPDGESNCANTAAQILLEISRLKMKRFQRQSGYWTSDSSPDQSPCHHGVA